MMIIRWFQGVYLLTEVEENSAIIDMRSSSGWHPLWLSMGVSDRSIESSLSCFSSFSKPIYCQMRSGLGAGVQTQTSGTFQTE